MGRKTAGEQSEFIVVCNGSQICEQTWELVKKWTERMKEIYVLSLSHTGKKIMFYHSLKLSI